MEPITTAWMMSTLISGWLGNRGDFWLCKSTNSIYKRITSRIGEPANHHIQRAVRKSYLQATHMAVKKKLKDFNLLNLLNQTRVNLSEIESYISKELRTLNNDEKYIPVSVLDNKYQEILFPKKESALNRNDEIIINLKNAVIDEFERRRFRVSNELKNMILTGWEDKGKKYDFHELIMAFFRKELKNNTQLSTYIQTEYLDQIADDTAKIKIEVDSLISQMKPFWDKYNEVISKIDKVLTGQNLIKDSQQKIAISQVEIKQELKALQEKLNFQFEGLERTPNITISKQFQLLNNKLDIKLNELKDHKLDLDEARVELKGALEINFERKERIVRRAEARWVKASEETQTIKEELKDFINQVVSLAREIEQLRGKNIDDSYRLKDAIRLFDKGHFEEANEILNPKDIYNSIKKEKEKLTILAEELLLKAKISLVLKQEGWFETVNQYYKDASEILDEYEYYFEYANFLLEHHNEQEALSYFDKALIKNNSIEEKIAVQIKKGSIFKSKFDLEIAKEIFLKCENTLDSFTSPYSLKQKSLLIDLYVNLAELYHQLIFIEKSNLYYNRAVSLSEENLGFDFSDSSLSFIDILISKTLFHYSTNRLGIAIKTIKKIQSLLNQKNLKSKTDEIYNKSIMGKIANIEGLINLKKNDSVGAKIDAREKLKLSTKLFKELSEDNPYSFLEDYAISLNNLGCVYGNLDNLNEALNLARDLSTANQNKYLKLLALTYNNLGLATLYDFNLANEYFENSYEIYKKLSINNPVEYYPELSNVLSNKGILAKRHKDYKKAETYYLQALELNEKLMRISKRKFQINYAEVANNLGILYLFWLKDIKNGYHFLNLAALNSKPFLNSLAKANKIYDQCLIYIKKTSDNKG